jgi:hypothetical protein
MNEASCQHKRRETRLVHRVDDSFPFAPQCLDCGVFIHDEARDAAPSPEDEKRLKNFDWDLWYAGRRRARQGRAPTLGLLDNEEMAALMYEDCKRHHISKDLRRCLVEGVWIGDYVFNPQTRKIVATAVIKRH